MRTLLAPTTKATGPALHTDPLEEHLSRSDSRASQADSEIDGKVIDRAEKALRNLGQGGLERSALLGLLLARLQTVDFATTCILLDVKPARLVKMMHGEDSIPKSFEARWKAIADALGDLHFVLEPTATPRWLETPIPALDGRTPLETIRRNQADRVGRLTKSYRDSSFA